MKESNEKNLLIVDDNRMNVELLIETLKPFGFNILSYYNPMQALEEVENKKIELALLDVVMPEMDGFDLAGKFAQNHSNTPIIFVSAHGTPENKIKGYNLGSYAYIEKPYDVKTIRAQVSSILKIKTLQDELFKEKEKLDNIFAFSSDEIILTDENLTITSKNHRIFIGGYREHTNLYDLLKKYKQYEIISLLKDFTNSDEKKMTFRMTINETIVNSKISKMYDNQNNLIGYLVVIRDITDEIKTINQKEQFIATLTHDLKTPIRAESAALELLLKGSYGPLSEIQEEIVREILNSSKFMAHMMDNLLARYKIDRKDVSLRKELNNLKITVQKCADNLQYLLQDKKQTLKIKIDLENDKFMYDEVEIIRVLNNLLNNASEYSPENSEITIRVSKKSSTVSVSVSDNGMGISQKDLKNIFNEHASNAKKFKKVGSGLGLFISKKIVESHGGKISVTSKPGQGATFTFTLPFCQSADEKIAS